MSDENTTPKPAEQATQSSASTMPPTAPVGAEQVGADTTAAATTGTDSSFGAESTGDREPVDSVGGTGESPVASVANAAADAAKKASARVREAAENVDLDQFSEQAKRVSDDVTARVKEEYKKRPGVVIGVAIGAVAVVAAIARAIGRRR